MGLQASQDTAPAAALRCSQASRCAPPCPQRRQPGLGYRSVLLKGGLCRDLGSSQTGSNTPQHLRGPQSWSLGRPSGTSGCFPNPRPPSPEPRCALTPGAGAGSSSGPRCQCHPHARVGITVLAVPNNATAPWQRERQARYKSFSETYSKSTLR